MSAVWLKVSGMYLAKRGCEYVTSTFTATSINLILSNSLTYAEEGMASNGSEPVSSLTDSFSFTGLRGERTVRESSCDTTGSKPLKTEQECPKSRNTELV